MTISQDIATYAVLAMQAYDFMDEWQDPVDPCRGWARRGSGEARRACKRGLGREHQGLR